MFNFRTLFRSYGLGFVFSLTLFQDKDSRILACKIIVRLIVFDLTAEVKEF